MIATQREREDLISRLIARGELALDKRDTYAEGSKGYWANHDAAIDWFTFAESLMPGGHSCF